MAKTWDDSIKRLIRANPQHFVSWLLSRDISFKRAASIELKNITRETDSLLVVEIDGREVLLHIEVQSREDVNMAPRLLEYNVLACREHNVLVYSFVIYLRKDSNIAESPLEWVLPNGKKVLAFYFDVVKLWEIPAEQLLETGLVGLLPLLPLTVGGTEYTSIEKMVTKIVEAEQFELLSLAESFAGLVIKDPSDRDWLKRSFKMYKDILEESWVIQEYQLEAEIKRVRKMLTGAVQMRFPEMLEMIKKRTEGVKDPDALQDLTLKIAFAHSMNDAMAALMEIPESSKLEEPVVEH